MEITLRMLLGLLCVCVSERRQSMILVGGRIRTGRWDMWGLRGRERLIVKLMSAVVRIIEIVWLNERLGRRSVWEDVELERMGLILCLLSKVCELVLSVKGTGEHREHRWLGKGRKKGLMRRRESTRRRGEEVSSGWRTK